MQDEDKITTVEPEVVTNEPRFYGKTQQAVKLHLEHGVDLKEAMALTTGKVPDSGNLSRLREKVRKYSLSRPAMVKLAHKAVEETLKMQPIVTSDGKEIFPSHTNRLAAAAMIADRVEPVVRVNQNMNINVDIRDLIPADLGEYE